MEEFVWLLAREIGLVPWNTFWSSYWFWWFCLLCCQSSGLPSSFFTRTPLLPDANNTEKGSNARMDMGRDRLGLSAALPGVWSWGWNHMPWMLWDNQARANKCLPILQCLCKQNWTLPKLRKSEARLRTISGFCLLRRGNQGSYPPIEIPKWCGSCQGSGELLAQSDPSWKLGNWSGCPDPSLKTQARAARLQPGRAACKARSRSAQKAYLDGGAKPDQRKGFPGGFERSIAKGECARSFWGWASYSEGKKDIVDRRCFHNWCYAWIRLTSTAGC